MVGWSSWTLDVNYFKYFFLKFQKSFKMMAVLVLTPDLSNDRIYQMRIKNIEIYCP